MGKVEAVNGPKAGRSEKIKALIRRYKVVTQALYRYELQEKK